MPPTPDPGEDGIYGAEDCIWLDVWGVAGLINFPPEVGGWVSDEEILLEKWEHGMDMRALDYCIHEDEHYLISVQVVLGHKDVADDEELHLTKHGGEGGECHRWTLGDDDIITMIQYTFDWHSQKVVEISFVTAN